MRLYVSQEFAYDWPQRGMKITTGFVVEISECCSWQMFIEVARSSVLDVMHYKAVLLSTDNCC